VPENIKLTAFSGNDNGILVAQYVKIEKPNFILSADHR
jgi:hypothetical protein